MQASPNPRSQPPCARPAKNLWLSPTRNPLRKFKEVILTRRLERALSKSRILEIYLNVAEFGAGIYGVGAAAEHYFYKPASDLTEHESAMLAASLPRPSRWNPSSHSAYYLRYVEDIEGRLERAEFLWRHVAPDRP
jgi:monofunctional biosynthetic peptidoglycan transglycosylase